MSTNGLETQKMLYQEVCESYHRVDDLRTKLLALLPLATAGASFVVLRQANQATSGSRQYLVALGIFGCLTTLGLFSYELQGIKRCWLLMQLGQQIEEDLGFKGQFRLPQPYVAGFIGAPLAACIIYSVVLGAWLYLALVTITSMTWLVVLAVSIMAFDFSIKLVYMERAKQVSNVVNVVASIHVKAGRLGDFRTIFLDNAHRVRKKRGCIEYLPTVDIKSGLEVQVLDDNVVTVIEKWNNVDALREHQESRPMQDYKERVKDIVEKVELKVLQDL